MTSRTFALVQLTIAGLALVGCVVSWLFSTTSEVVAPVTAGEPSKTSTVYDPSMILLALVLAAVATVAAVAGVARLRSS
jgi:hypothetical protein